MVFAIVQSLFCVMLMIHNVIRSKERQLGFWLLYRLKGRRYNIFRPSNRSEGGVAMDLRIVGLRIKEAREAKNLTQEDLAALVDLSPTHISVIERGLKAVKLDKFVAIANALDVSADRLLVDVVTRSVDGVANELSQAIKKFPPDEQKRIIKAVRAYVED